MMMVVLLLKKNRKMLLKKMLSIYSSKVGNLKWFMFHYHGNHLYNFSMGRIFDCCRLKKEWPR